MTKVLGLYIDFDLIKTCISISYMQIHDYKKINSSPQIKPAIDLQANLHSWIEISRVKMIQNIQIIKKAIGDAQLGVIIKGNAYGHGIVPVVQILQEVACVDWVIAFSLTEALMARQVGFTKKILVCGYADGLIENAIMHHIDLVLHDTASLERYKLAAQKLERPVYVHIKVDTGLNRLGFTPQQALLVILELQKSKQLIIRGLFSHFADSDAENNWYAQKQLNDFNKLLDDLAKLQIEIPIIHMANTVAVFRLSAACKSLVRVAGGVYGLRKTIAPDLIAQDYQQLQPVMTWKSRVIQVRDLQVGSFVSYGCTFKAEHNMRIATIPVGYADGYGRELSNNSVIYINGILAPVVGRVCMNLVIIDVTSAKSVCVGDEVVLLGDIDGVRIFDLMLRLKTIACDVTTSLNWTISRFIV